MITRRPLLKRLALPALLGIALAATAPAQAQWVVTDPALQAEVTANQATEITNQGVQITHLVEQYTQMITQYTSLLSELKSLNLNIIPVNNQLPLFNNPQDQVAKSCPGLSMMGTALGAIGIDPSITDGEIVTQQNVICANIVLLQVDKYNTVARMLNHMNDYFSGITRLTGQIDAIGNKVTSIVGSVTGSTGSAGDRQATQNQTDQAQLTLAAEMANAQQHLQAVDATIAALKDQQSLLANIALKGSNQLDLQTLGGQVIQAAAFQAAFSSANH